MLERPMIPFHAAYYRIPAVDVPVAGEEPFARIFLAGGESSSDPDAINSASENLAISIFAQLQQSIQEKTLAVMSNTLSAICEEEQKRKRANPFSSASSFLLRPKPAVPTAEVLFKLLSQSLDDPAFLSAVFVNGLQVDLNQLRDYLAPRPAWQEEENPPVGEAYMQVLFSSWRKRIEQQAKVTHEQLIEHLSERLNKIDLLARSSRRGLRQAACEITEIERLILLDFGPEKSEENLRRLRSLPDFADFELSLKADVHLYPRIAEGALEGV